MNVGLLGVDFEGTLESLTRLFSISQPNVGVAQRVQHAGLRRLERDGLSEMRNRLLEIALHIEAETETDDHLVAIGMLVLQGQEKAQGRFGLPRAEVGSGELPLRLRDFPIRFRHGALEEPLRGVEILHGPVLVAEDHRQEGAPLDVKAPAGEKGGPGNAGPRRDLKRRRLFGQHAPAGVLEPHPELIPIGDRAVEAELLLDEGRLGRDNGAGAFRHHFSLPEHREVQFVRRIGGEQLEYAVHGFAGREVAAGGRMDPRRTGLKRPERVGPVVRHHLRAKAEHHVAQRRLARRRVADANRALRHRVLTRHAIAQNQHHLVVARHQRDAVLVGERRALDRAQLRLRQLDEGLLLVRENEAAVRVPYLQTGVEGRERTRPVAVRIHREVLQSELDAEMEVGGAIRTDQHREAVLAGHEVERVLRRHPAAVALPGVEVVGADCVPRRSLDSRHGDLGPETDGAPPDVDRLRRVHGEGGPRQLRRNPEELLHVPLGKRARRAANQISRNVRTRNEQAILNRIQLLGEEQIEEGRHVLALVALIEPKLARIEIVVVVESLDAPGRAQDDVHPAPIRLPPGRERFAPELAVGVLQTAVVLLPELVDGSARDRIASSPERLDESASLLHRAEQAENVRFPFGDDVGHLFLQPPAVFRSELLRGSGARCRGRR